LHKCGVESASPERIRKAVNRMEFTEVDLKGQSFYIKTKRIKLSNKILKAMHIQPSKNFFPVSEFRP
jgi:hypothetical protein